MIQFLIWVFILVSVAFAQKRGNYDKNIHASDTLETDNVFMYQDTIIPVTDIAYWEWSADGVTFSKYYTENDTWARYSGLAKLDWDTIRFALNLWELSGDTVKPIDATIVFGDTIIGGRVVSDVYFLGGDTLNHTNIYNGGDGQDGQILVYRGDTARWEAASGVGEINLMENAGTRGVGVYDHKEDTLFVMRNIASLTDLLTVALNSADSVIDLDLNLKTITAGIGLSGGGNMETDITINLYIPELTNTTRVNYLDDRLAIYSADSSTHYKIAPRTLLPALYLNDTLDYSHADTLNLIAGDNVTITGESNGNVTISSTGGTAELPTCDEGQILMFLSGEWSCVDLCDYICYDQIIDTVYQIIQDYNDSTQILPNGDVLVNFQRTECEDSVLITPTNFVSSTLNLTGIAIPSIPTVGELHYGGVAVEADDTLFVTLGSFNEDVYYVTNSGVGSSYTDNFTFESLYSSNSVSTGTFTFSVGVSACFTEQVCYGYLYNLYAVDDTRELSSADGWYVPSYAQVRSLADYLGASGSYTSNSVSLKLKATGTTFWDTDRGQTDQYGFHAIGSGTRNGATGAYGQIGTGFYHWLSDRSGGLGGKGVMLNSDDAYSVNSGYTNARYGYSVRFVADATGISDGVTTTYTGNDGKTYTAIAINQLYWMTSNLEETEYRNGNYIPNVEDDATWAGLTGGALCAYDNNQSYICSNPLATFTYDEINLGYLYSWYSVVSASNIANDGWSVPDTTDFNTLVSFIGGISNGGDLKEAGTTHWTTPNTGATNSTGFNARGVGYRSTYSYTKINEYFSSYLAEEFDISNGYAIRLDYNSESVSKNAKTKWSGGSVRLIKDSTTLSNGESGIYIGNDGKVYRTICIGTQEWMADNLAETEYRNGDLIPEKNITIPWSGFNFYGRCVYDDDENNR